MTSVRILLLVGLFGAAGAMARFSLSGWVARHASPDFPLATLVVNGLGCFLIGVLSAAGQASALPDTWRVALGAGFLGGLTTFSTFGYETVMHLSERHWMVAFGNVVGSLTIGFGFVWCGAQLGRMLWP